MQPVVYRDLKSGDCLFFTSPPEFQRPTTTPPPPPQKNNDPAPNGNDLGHHMTSYMMYILLKLIFVNDKNAPETVLRIRKIHVLS